MNKKSIVIGLAVIIILFLIPYSLPLILAFVTAVMLDPIVKYVGKKSKLKRIYAVTITFLLYILLLLVVSYLSITVIINQLILFVKNIPYFMSSIDVSRIDSLVVKWNNYIEKLPVDLVDSFEDSIDSLKQMLIELAKNITEGTFIFLSNVPEFLLQFLVYIISVFLFSNELAVIYKKTDNLFERTTKAKVMILLSQIYKVLFGFLKAQLILSTVTFVVALVGLLLLDSNYPVVLSLLIVIVDLLPILGTGSFIVPWAIYSFINGDQQAGFGLLILFGVITIVRRIIEPKIFSSNLGISALAALISMYIGFQLLGFIGLIAGPGIILLYDALVKADIFKNRMKFSKN
ncbi:sporulation integral membrane protein YtvI [Cytobacillus sp. S13-E01]|uniref:sporulation integral membrane protein YtvI n=1 Tax=Cytobacillus sp. S13-E01 TaxID=3031326 RepID=UPI0023D88BCD|nr:sporulation integral membrane protein YtvI [Cytobacillus sp. S13-E01]MDF0727985.1 sporulation integral membrane protein YtvI [Cytobacillus sp. S13-E01]